MDTSETYIKMRIAARGDIPYKKYANPSSLLSLENGVILGNDGNYYCEYDAETKIVSCDLPRQDQLQEMMGVKTVYDFTDKCLSNYNLICGGPSGEVFVNEKLSLGNGLYCTNSASMEQLWLTFVMREKFGKVWTGEEWDELL